MFKKKHVFTCPDVIYLRARQKKINRTVILMETAIVLVGIAYIAYEDRKTTKTEPLTEDTTSDFPQYN